MARRYVHDEDGRGIRTVADRTYPVFGAVCAACVVVITNVRDRTMTKTLAGLAGVLFFVASIAHHLLDTCDVRFEGGRLRASSGPLWGKTRVEHLVADIDRFVAVPPDVVDDDFLRLYLVTREGAKVALPFDLGGATSAVPAEAERLVERLGELLESARREGIGYRIAGVAPGEAHDGREPPHVG